MADKVCGGLSLILTISLLASCCIQGSLGGSTLHNDACTQTSDCVTDSNMECRYPTNRPPGCDVKQCLCPTGQMYKLNGSLPLYQCVEVTTIGSACTMNEHYKCPLLSNCTAEGSNYYCRCMANYRPAPNNQMCIPDVLCAVGACGYMGGNCTSDTQCSTGLRCLSNDCVCNAGYEYYAPWGICIPMTTTQCNGTGTACLSVSSLFSNLANLGNIFELKCDANGKCMCPTKYERHQTTKFCVPVKDYACTADTDCVGAMTCTVSKCACPSGTAFTYYHPTACVADSGANRLLATDTETCTLLPSISTIVKYCGATKHCVSCGEVMGDVPRCISLPTPGNGAKPYTPSCLVAILAAAGALLFQY